MEYVDYVYTDLMSVSSGRLKICEIEEVAGPSGVMNSQRTCSVEIKKSRPSVAE